LFVFISNLTIETKLMNWFEYWWRLTGDISLFFEFRCVWIDSVSYLILAVLYQFVVWTREELQTAKTDLIQLHLLQRIGNYFISPLLTLCLIYWFDLLCCFIWLWLFYKCSFCYIVIVCK
jgi:hypothetical protein